MNENLGISEALRKKIFDFLHYGYVMPDNIPSFLTELQKHKYKPRKVTLSNTIELFEEVFTDSIEMNAGSGFCIVPLSGGWDSRILLGYALERFPSRQIKTYTFGTKGQLDFDIGKKIAKKAGVEHIAFDLSQIQLTWESLKASVTETPWTYTADSFFNKYCYRQMQSNADILLSGFMGDPLTGGHVYQNNGPDIKNIFLESQTLASNHLISESDFDPVSMLPDLPGNTLFSEHQLLDLGIRQAHCIAPIVSFKKKWDSWDTSLGTIGESKTKIIAPFAHPEWIHYWLHTPDMYKQNRLLYLQFLQEKFPELRDISNKEFYGAKNVNDSAYYLNKKIYHGKILLHRYYPRIFSSPKEMLNYLDFDKAFRKRKDYKDILENAFTLLAEHSIITEADFKKLKDEHLKYRKNHSRLFLLLIGLALNMEIELQGEFI